MARGLRDAGYPAVHWRKPDTSASASPSPFQTCSFCGSIAPQDLYPFLLDPPAAFQMHMADWKYGWPHKLYIDGLPNPWKGVEVVVSSTYQYGKIIEGSEVRAPGGPHVHAKFYSIHLLDLYGVALTKFLEALHKHTRLRFDVRIENGDRQLGWQLLPADAGDGDAED